jgi:RNA polymerase sigma-70 factor (ECF subfamily)
LPIRLVFPEFSGSVTAMPLSDDELMRAVAAGDREAFAALYDRHAPAVFGLLRTMLPGHGEAEDVLQEAFLQAWRQADRYDSTRSTPVGWLVMMARSRALDFLRHRPPILTSDPPDRPVVSDVDSRLDRNESAAAVHRALGQLADDQQIAIRLAFFGGLTYEQVAGRLGVPAGTAKTRIRLGLMKLRKALEPTDGPESDSGRR